MRFLITWSGRGVCPLEKVRKKKEKVRSERKGVILQNVTQYYNHFVNLEKEKRERNREELF